MLTDREAVLGETVTVSWSGVAISAACSTLLRNGNTSYRHAQRADIDAPIVYDRGHNMPDDHRREMFGARAGDEGRESPDAGARDDAGSSQPSVRSVRRMLMSLKVG